MRRRSFIRGAAALGLLAGAANAQTYVRAFGSYALPPNTAAWLATIQANGSSVSANTLSAVAALELQLLHCGLLPQIVYLNPRCGNSLVAAKVPLIFTSGPGFDVTSGSFSAWSEANGFKGTTGVADTGVAANAVFSTTVGTLGVYNLVNFSPGSANYALGDASNWGLEPYNGNYIIFDNYNAGTGRTQTNSALIYDGANNAGLISGSRYGASSADVSRNGSIRGIAAGVASGSLPTANVKVYSQYCQSGGDFIAAGLSQDQIAMMTWLLHNFNTTLGRAAVAEGLF